MQVGRRIDAELIGEQLPGVSIDLKGLSLTAQPVQREHKVAPQSFAERMLSHQGLQFADELGMSAKRKVRLDPVLHHREPEVLNPRDCRLCEGLVRELRERCAAPQTQGLSKDLRGPFGLAGCESSPPFARDSLEVLEIDGTGLDTQDVSGSLPDEKGIGRLRPFCPKRLAQLGHVDLQGVSGAVGRLVAPQVIDQPVGGNDPVGVKNQDGEERALLCSSKREHPPLDDDLERPEHAELHLCPPSGP